MNSTDLYCYENACGANTVGVCYYLIGVITTLVGVICYCALRYKEFYGRVAIYENAFNGGYYIASDQYLPPPHHIKVEKLEKCEELHNDTESSGYIPSIYSRKHFKLYVEQKDKIITLRKPKGTNHFALEVSFLYKFNKTFIGDQISLDPSNKGHLKCTLIKSVMDVVIGMSKNRIKDVNMESINDMKEFAGTMGVEFYNRGIFNVKNVCIDCVTFCKYE